MTTTYFRRQPFGLSPLYAEGVVVSDDDTPTLYYYGTVTLSRRLSDEEVERFDLVEATEEVEEDVADGEALYRAEMRHCY